LQSIETDIECYVLSRQKAAAAEGIQTENIIVFLCLLVVSAAGGFVYTKTNRKRGGITRNTPTRPSTPGGGYRFLSPQKKGE